jgi:class 3 adenylate cyclase
MRFLRSSITLKISLLVLGSTCIDLALVLGRSYTNSRDLIRQEAETSARNLTVALGNKIEQEFLVVSKAVQDLTSSLEAVPWDEDTLLNQIRRMVQETPRAHGIVVAFLPFEFRPGIEKYAPYFRWSKGEISFNQLGTESYDYFAKDWFRISRDQGKAVWIEPYVDEGAGRVVMTTYSCPMSRRPSDGSGEKIMAIVAAEISLAALNDLVNSQRVYESGFCFVLSDKGAVITSRVPERIGRMSVFDIVELYKQPRGQEIARTILSKEHGFEDIGSAMTGADSFLAFTRINPPGWIVGTILPKREMFAKVESLHHQTMMLATAGIALLVLLSVLVARSISRPLRRMASETLRVGQGDLDIDLSTIRSIDEVGQLARAFTAMTEGLKDRERIKDTFGRYLTQEVVKRLLDSKDGLKLGGEARKISIMMSDLRGFTSLTSSMKPEDVIKFLNRYLGKMVDIILDHHGIIDEIIGDGILAFFGAPETLENHPELAVACALKMQIAMHDINAQNEADGLPHLEMGVAVNTGEVIVGNIGSEKRTKYGAVGSQVNFTGRVESFTVGGQVLISQATYESLSQKLDIRDAVDVEMKGVPGPVKLYDVRGILGAHEAKLPDRDETLVRLTEGVALLVFGIDQKILTGGGKTAVMTHASLMSAKVLFDDPVTKWEDVRMLCKIGPADESKAEIYGKIISVTPLDRGSEGLVRFTSVSAPAYEMLRELLGTTLSSEM